MHMEREGTIDVTIHRNRYGFISGVTAQHEGDEMFDGHTRDFRLDR